MTWCSLRRAFDVGEQPVDVALEAELFEPEAVVRLVDAVIAVDDGRCVVVSGSVAHRPDTLEQIDPGGQPGSTPAQVVSRLESKFGTGWRV